MKTLKNFFATVMLVLITATAYTQEEYATVKFVTDGGFVFNNEIEVDTTTYNNYTIYTYTTTLYLNQIFEITIDGMNWVLYKTGNDFVYYNTQVNPTICLGCDENDINDLEPGYYVASYHASSIVTTYKINITVSEYALSISDLVSVTGLNLYPNPVVDYLTVDFETSEMNMPVEVINGAGQIVYADNEMRYVGQNKVMVPMFDQPNGVYFVRIGNQTRKVLK